LIKKPLFNNVIIVVSILLLEVCNESTEITIGTNEVELVSHNIKTKTSVHDYFSYCEYKEVISYI
jgi:hypothetical protein